MAQRIAAIVIAGGKRQTLIDERIVPSLAGFDEILVVGKHHEGDDYRYLHVPDLTKTTNDAGTAMPCRWQSGGPIATSPQEQKTVNEFRVDYEADSTSHLTVRFSQDQGNSFVTSVPVPLPTASQGSQGIGYPYFGCRYPTFDILSEGYRHRLSQFYLTHKQGGR